MFGVRGCATTGRAGGFQGESSVPFGVNLINSASVAANFGTCHEKNGVSGGREELSKGRCRINMTKEEILERFFTRYDMSPREEETLRRLVARANPPPILYRYRRPNESTIREIAMRTVYAATPDDLNDPFECSAPLLCDKDSMKRYFLEVFAPTRGLSAEEAEAEFDSYEFEEIKHFLVSGLDSVRKQSGIICFSAVPDSIRMWSYYADSHKGICIGYDTSFGPFSAAIEVSYQNPDKSLDLAAALREDPSQLAAHITLRKAAEWEFEKEYRIPVGPIGDRPRAFPYPAQAIAEIRLGARIDPDFKAKLLDDVSRLEQRPRLIQVGCDFERFVLTKLSL